MQLGFPGRFLEVFFNVSAITDKSRAQEQFEAPADQRQAMLGRIAKGLASDCSKRAGTPHARNRRPTKIKNPKPLPECPAKPTN
jgi:hypothetical protein